jgi:hypothetical protein
VDDRTDRERSAEAEHLRAKPQGRCLIAIHTIPALAYPQPLPGSGRTDPRCEQRTRRDGMTARSNAFLQEIAGFRGPV